MGCVHTVPKDVEDIDREVLANFLQNKENLKAIWKQFNKNEDEYLDRGEFDRLLFSALQIFCKERDPDMPPPTRDSLEPFIVRLREELAPRIDIDNDGVISFNEFKSFGEYLKKEYRKLQTQHTMKSIDSNIGVITNDAGINTAGNATGPTGISGVDTTRFDRGYSGTTSTNGVAYGNNNYPISNNNIIRS
jgi:hypothetical protein